MNASSPLIRTFRARDARSALTAVKAAFGPDAVIIETKQVQGGLFSKPQIEVTAAADARSANPAHLDRAVETDVAALRRVMEDVRRSLNRRDAAELPERAGPANRERDRERDHDRGRPGDDDRRHGSAEAELGGEARKAFRHLLERGVEEVLARELLDDALLTGVTRTPEILRAIAAALGKVLRAAPAPWGADARRTIALVGPTGVGKTTAIAKIAARALLETQFKVGLITVDTYRVGASDQLARYGKIMGVPTYVARDQAALADAIDRTRDADLVLIDTAGRSDTASIEAQMKMVQSAPNVQLHLVMSLATGARELGAVARRYRSFGAERLIFTKLDEADGPGGALSALAVLARPVSCLCDGQRVPEDIHPVTESELCQRLIGIGPNGTLAGTHKERLRGSSQ
jgi:flagellar biosynthesis protein FlhF